MMLYSTSNGGGFIAANRLGLGARPGEAQAMQTDPKGAVLMQVDSNLGAGSRNAFDITQANEALVAMFEAQNQPQATRREALDASRLLARRTYGRGVNALINAQLGSSTPFAERWSALLSNHLTVSATAGPQIRAMLPLYEFEVIRPNCFGRFADLVFASATHAAMLTYLDQARSVGPNSRAGQRRAELGLNENYARELLELHTVGVDGGYDLHDIQNLAKLLTGWTISGPRALRRLLRNVDADLGEVIFVDDLHEPGPKTIMGQTYAQGQDATRQIIEDLCRLPQTARHICTKIANHFIGNAITEPDMETLVSAYLDSDGNLAEVARALINLDTVWQAEAPLFRTPQEYLVALFRGLEIDALDQRTRESARQFLTDAQHMPWTAALPQGWSQETNAWADPNALKSRTDFARTAAMRLTSLKPQLDPTGLGEQILDLSAAPALASALGNATDRSQALGILLASPQFMWR